MNRYLYPWFHLRLPHELQKVFHDYGHVTKYKKGDKIIDLIDKPKEISLIIKGCCMFDEYSIDGKGISLGILMPNTTYGEPALSNDYMRVTTIALEDTEVLKLPLTPLYKALANDIELNKCMLKYLMDKVNYFEYIRYHHYQSNIQQRLAVFLKSYVIFNDAKPRSDGFYKMSIKLTHSLLAEILNTGRSTISMVIAYLAKENLLHFDHKCLYFSQKLIDDDMINTTLKELSWAEIRQKSM